VWIGDSSHAVVAPDYLIDLSRDGLSVGELAALSASALAFIGGDSGPLHLAAAAGVYVIAVERTDGGLDEGFGPFCPPSQGVKLSIASSTVNEIVDVLAERQRSAPGMGRSTKSSPNPPLAARTRSDASFFSSISAGPNSSEIIELYQNQMRSTGIQGDYMPFRTTDLRRAADFLISAGVQGFSVSAPYKVAALPLTTSLDATAEAVGAVNTVVRSGAGWRGYNTDVGGLLACLDRIGVLKRLTGVSALVLGSGGAARAALHVLASRGAIASAFSRNKETLESACAAFGASGLQASEVAGGAFELIINATGATLDDPDFEPLLANVGRTPSAIYLDMALGPAVERTVQAMRDRGCVALDGWTMLEAQARLQVQLFADCLNKPSTPTQAVLEHA
jgi:shikimate dehydrogenase